MSEVTVWIPPLLQELTGGTRQIIVSGRSVSDVIIGLEQRYPGIECRLVEDGRIRPGIAVVVDNEVSKKGLRQQLKEKSEVHFLPALSGG